VPETVPISLDSLTRISRSDALILSAAGRIAEALRRLAPSIESVVERYVGERVKLRFVVPRLVGDMRPRTAGERFDGIVACLRSQEPPLSLLFMVPSALCRALAGAVLGSSRTGPFADPSLGEAVVTHLVADVLRCLPFSVPLVRLDAIASASGPEDVPDPGPAAVLYVRVRIGGLTDILTVVLPESGLPALARSEAWHGVLGGAPAPLALRYSAIAVCGAGMLDLDDLAGLEEGDVVVVDRLVPGLGTRGPEPAAVMDLAVSGASGPVFLVPVAAEGRRLRVEDGGPIIMEGDMDRDDERTAIDEVPGERRVVDEADRSRVRELPAEVVVEAARVSMSVGELLALAPGAVIALERPVSAEVTLSAGGRRLAHGVLVDVEGELGVQVLKLID
jgi:flagellar motor switch/type III secretory pathway protein FliN